jgi:hypothetical protein
MVKNPFEVLTSYRLYWIGGNIHVPRGEWVHCRDDAEAIACAEAALGSEPLEVWEGTRRVERLDPAFSTETRARVVEAAPKFAVLQGNGSAKFISSNASRSGELKRRA